MSKKINVPFQVLLILFNGTQPFQLRYYKQVPHHCSTTVVGGPSLSSSPLFLSIFFLNRYKPHVGHAFIEANSYLYNTKSLGLALSFDIPNLLDIEFSSPHNHK